MRSNKSFLLPAIGGASPNAIYASTETGTDLVAFIKLRVRSLFKKDSLRFIANEARNIEFAVLPTRRRVVVYFLRDSKANGPRKRALKLPPVCRLSSREVICAACWLSAAPNKNEGLFVV